MFYCGPCDTVHRLRLSACPACRGPLVIFGSDSSHRAHPVARSRPMARPPVSRGGSKSSSGPSQPPLEPPARRAPVRAWREWGAAAGISHPETWSKDDLVAHARGLEAA